MADIAVVLGFGLADLCAMTLDELMDWHELARERAEGKD